MCKKKIKINFFCNGIESTTYSIQIKLFEAFHDYIRTGFSEEQSMSTYDKIVKLKPINILKYVLEKEHCAANLCAPSHTTPKTHKSRLNLPI